MSITSDPIILATFGTSLMASCVQTATFTLMYGMFILLFAQFTVSHMKKPKRSHAESRMYLTSTFTFALATIHEASLLATSGISIHSFLIGDQALPLIEKGQKIYELVKTPNILFSWMASMEVIVSDGIVVWRAYILLQNRRWLVLIPSFLLLFSLALVLVYLVVLITDADRGHIWIKYCLGTSLALSLATNVASTTIIGYIYWIHRSDRQITGQMHQPTWPERVLAQLVESGIIFCVLQAVNLGIQTSIPHGLAGTVFASIHYGFCAMFPTMVIVLVNNQRSEDNVHLPEAFHSQNTHSKDSNNANMVRLVPGDPETQNYQHGIPPMHLSGLNN